MIERVHERGQKQNPRTWQYNFDIKKLLECSTIIHKT